MQNKGVTPHVLAIDSTGPPPVYVFTSGIYLVETSCTKTMPDNTGPAKPEQSVVRIRYRGREGACSFRNVEPIRFHNRALVRDWVVSSTICDPLVFVGSHRESLCRQRLMHRAHNRRSGLTRCQSAKRNDGSLMKSESAYSCEVPRSRWRLGINMRRLP